MKTLSATLFTRTTLLAISASLLATIVMAGEAPKSAGGDTTTHAPVMVTPGVERPGMIASEPAADKRAYRLKHSYDAGDFYYYQGERMPLLRSLTELVVEFREDVCEERKRNIVDSTFLDANVVD